MFDGPARSQLGEEPPAVLRLRPNADGDGYGLEEVPPASAVTPARGINFAEMLQIPGVISDLDSMMQGMASPEDTPQASTLLTPEEEAELERQSQARTAAALPWNPRKVHYSQRQDLQDYFRSDTIAREKAWKQAVVEKQVLDSIWKESASRCAAARLVQGDAFTPCQALFGTMISGIPNVSRETADGRAFQAPPEPEMPTRTEQQSSKQFVLALRTFKVSAEQVHRNLRKTRIKEGARKAREGALRCCGCATLQRVHLTNTKPRTKSRLTALSAIKWSAKTDPFRLGVQPIGERWGWRKTDKPPRFVDGPEARMLTAICKLLQKHGFEVSTASWSNKALSATAVHTKVKQDANRRLSLLSGATMDIDESVANLHSPPTPRGAGAAAARAQSASPPLPGAVRGPLWSASLRSREEAQKAPPAPAPEPEAKKQDAEALQRANWKKARLIRERFRRVSVTEQIATVAMDRAIAKISMMKALSDTARMAAVSRAAEEAGIVPFVEAKRVEGSQTLQISCRLEVQHSDTRKYWRLVAVVRTSVLSSIPNPCDAHKRRQCFSKDFKEDLLLTMKSAIRPPTPPADVRDAGSSEPRRGRIATTATPAPARRGSVGEFSLVSVDGEEEMRAQDRAEAAP